MLCCVFELDVLLFHIDSTQWLSTQKGVAPYRQGRKIVDLDIYSHKSRDFFVGQWQTGLSPVVGQQNASSPLGLALY